MSHVFECAECGGEVSVVNDDGVCDKCVAEFEDDTDSEYCCIDCSGSGEGQYDGTRCHYCKGTGVERNHG